jgi:hypothetical protein
MEPENTDAEPLGDEEPMTPTAPAPPEAPVTGDGFDLGVDLSLYELPANGALLHKIQAKRAERRREEEELEAAMAGITRPRTSQTTRQTPRPEHRTARSPGAYASTGSNLRRCSTVSSAASTRPSYT